ATHLRLASFLCHVPSAQRYLDECRASFYYHIQSLKDSNPAKLIIKQFTLHALSHKPRYAHLVHLATLRTDTIKKELSVDQRFRHFARKHHCFEMLRLAAGALANRTLISATRGEYLDPILKIQDRTIFNAARHTRFGLPGWLQRSRECPLYPQHKFSTTRCINVCLLHHNQTLLQGDTLAHLTQASLEALAEKIKTSYNLSTPPNKLNALDALLHHELYDEFLKYYQYIDELLRNPPTQPHFPPPPPSAPPTNPSHPPRRPRQINPLDAWLRGTHSGRPPDEAST
ncbi:hypothetical protein HDV05_000794, partial [Chytridiales sp. JEL 0842]